MTGLNNRKFRLSDYIVVVAQVILGVVTIVAIPMFFIRGDTEQTFTQPFQVLIGLGVAIATTVLPLSFLLSKLIADVDELKQHNHAEDVKIEARNATDIDLLNFQEAFAQIAADERGSLIQSVLATELSKLRCLAVDSRNSMALEVDPDFVTTEPLINSLKRTDTVHLVHYLDNNDWFFGEHSLSFNRQFIEKIARGRQKLVEGVERLLVVTNPNELQDPLTWMLIAFHGDAPLHSYRLIAEERFVQMQRDQRFREDGRLDFGVFGDNYVYESGQNPFGSFKTSPHGRFSSNPDDIDRYTRLFSHTWKSVWAAEAPAEVSKAVRAVYSATHGGRSANATTKIATLDDLVAVASHRDPLMADIKKRAIVPKRFLGAGLPDSWTTQRKNP